MFRWRDSAHKNKKRLMRLALDEFLRRFFLHVLPKGFVRIRHFGFFAHRRRAALLPLCFALLGQTGDSQTVTDSTRRTRHGRYGFAPSAAAPWRSWSDSPPLRRASALPRSATWNDYDPLFVISKLVSAGAPAGEDCPPAVWIAPPPIAPLSNGVSWSPGCASCSAYLILSRHQQRNSKRITPQCQTGSLQVAVSKTLRRSDFASCSKLIAPERFRYSPRTCRALRVRMTGPVIVWRFLNAAGFSSGNRGQC